MAIPLLPAPGGVSHGANVPVVYGIPNCDTVQKARRWLDDKGMAHRFHDFKKHGLPADRLTAWIDAVGLEALVNRRGTTWRGLDADEQAALQSLAEAPAVLLRHPSTVRRPVVEWPSPTGLAAAPAVTVGFDPATWQLRVFGSATAPAPPGA